MNLPLKKKSNIGSKLLIAMGSVLSLGGLLSIFDNTMPLGSAISFLVILGILPVSLGLYKISRNKKDLEEDQKIYLEQGFIKMSLQQKQFGITHVASELGISIQQARELTEMM